ncbi:MraY family glycosyltransferase [Paenibacillus koleovorans]|uniref:MraY family glycosyltransferase n=1 Tax=Paenibacillus koleovorans TaxID=121608 RepID=UPI000FDB6EC7|nr:MraY family glycosyltransferase [Paenibacillus koleovorans]
MQSFIPLATSFLLVLALVPFARILALRIGFVDRPTGRKIHKRPIPLMGGAAIYIGCIISLLLYDGWSSRFITVAIGGTAILIIGLIDDWYKTKAVEFSVWPRIIVYILAAAVPVWQGIQITGISKVSGGMYVFPAGVGAIATMLWVFGIMNMINFIDGVDGLASGIVTISAFTLLVAALLAGEEGTAVMAAIVVGACAAFLVFNYYPARIFMGDAGAVFLGYVLAVLAVDGTLKRATFVSIAVPVLAIGVPILDTVIVFGRRLLSGKGLHRADKLHTHHTLMRWGLSQTQTVSFMYLIGVLFSLLSIILVLAMT